MQTPTSRKAFLLKLGDLVVIAVGSFVMGIWVMQQVEFGMVDPSIPPDMGSPVSRLHTAASVKQCVSQHKK